MGRGEGVQETVLRVTAGGSRGGMGIGSGEIGLTRVASGIRGVPKSKTLSTMAGSSKSRRKLSMASSSDTSHIQATLETTRVLILRNHSSSVSGKALALWMAS